MLREIAAGTVLVFVLLGLACSSGLPPVVRCKLEAVRVLPDDPMQATVYDAVDVIERLRACHRLEADGGP
jgi:hypothetical protein